MESCIFLRTYSHHRLFFPGLCKFYIFYFKILVLPVTISSVIDILVLKSTGISLLAINKYSKMNIISVLIFRVLLLLNVVDEDKFFSNHLKLWQNLQLFQKCSAAPSFAGDLCEHPRPAMACWALWLVLSVCIPILGASLLQGYKKTMFPMTLRYI